MERFSCKGECGGIHERTRIEAWAIDKRLRLIFNAMLIKTIIIKYNST